METETKQTECSQFDETGIGTKDAQSLEVKPVIVQGYRNDVVMDKTDPSKKVGEKVVLVVKHPDREEVVELSKVRYLKNDKVTTSGLWFNRDPEGLIPKKSALAETMRRYECNTVSDFVGKTLATDLDNTYLVVKAY